MVGNDDQMVFHCSSVNPEEAIVWAVTPQGTTEEQNVAINKEVVISFIIFCLNLKLVKQFDEQRGLDEIYTGTIKERNRTNIRAEIQTKVYAPYDIKM